MAAASHIKGVTVEVYERRRHGGGYDRISCFPAPKAGGGGGVGGAPTVRVLYGGRMHYDALVVKGGAVPGAARESSPGGRQGQWRQQGQQGQQGQQSGVDAKRKWGQQHGQQQHGQQQHGQRQGGQQGQKGGKRHKHQHQQQRRRW